MKKSLTLVLINFTFLFGVAGFGRLGMMAVKYTVKMGAKVSVFARNENKKAEALQMGVSEFYTSTDKKVVKERFDLILSTIPTPYI